MKKNIFILLLTLTFLCSCSINGSKGKIFVKEGQTKESEQDAKAVSLLVENSSDGKIGIESEKDFFDRVTNQVKKDWETDARLYSIQGAISGSDIIRLTTLSHYYTWDMTYISSSRKRMITLSLPEPEEGFIDVSKILYPCRNTRTDQKAKALIKEIKESIEYMMDEEDIAKNSSSYILSNAWFADWVTDFNQIGRMIYERIKKEGNDAKSNLTLSILFKGKSDNMDFDVPVWEARWNDSKGNKRLFIINALTGEILMDI